VSAWQTTPLVVGHRGGRGEGWPAENTIDAFERARAEGARAVELDVRASADGSAVVFHDATLARMTGGRDSRRIDAVGASELRTIVLDGGARIPTLADVLGWGRECGVAVNVELKHGPTRPGELARATLRAARGARADVLFSSFDPRLLAWVAALAPAVPRAFLTHAGQDKWAYALREALRPPLVQAVHLEQKEADPAKLRRYRRRGLQLGVWTVNDAEVARRLADAGAGWIITDTPGAIVVALGSTSRAQPGITART
jgi:glycerophosphoryl diester phosphodiesterase